MADLDLVREDGGGERTVVTVRVPDSAWAGLESSVQIVTVRKTTWPVSIPRQRQPEWLPEVLEEVS